MFIRHKTVLFSDVFQNIMIYCDNFLSCSTLIGHDATILLACFTFDSSLIVTGCHDGVLKLWLNSGSSQDKHSSRENNKSLDMIRNAHDMGVTCGECAPFSGIYGRSLMKSL
jgi:hypothetical protein